MKKISMHIIAVVLFSFLVLASLEENALGEERNSETSKNPDDCSVRDLQSLKGCFSQRSHYKKINFADDVECSSGSCCSGDGLLVLDSASDLSVEGNGHKVTRHADQRSCSAISGRNTKNVTISNLVLDEDRASSPCEPSSQPCAASVAFGDASNIKLENVQIFYAKGFAISAVAVDGFVFDHSAIVEAGVIGLYVGKSSKGERSNHIKITNSVFARTRTNAIVFDGVKGSSQSDNRIESSIFTQNHMHGLYLDGTGKPNNGGQIYLPDVVNATVTKNIIGLGSCGVCNNPMVWGVELGATSSVHFLANTFFESYGVAFFKDSSATIDSSDIFDRNRVLSMTGLNLTGAVNGLGGGKISDNKVLGLAKSASEDIPSFKISRGGADISRRSERPGLKEDRPTADQDFFLSPTPRIGGSISPIFECSPAQDESAEDARNFVSVSATCEGHSVRKVVGFSFEPKNPNARPIYRCRTGDRHFVSWESTCAGAVAEGQIAYAIRTPSS